MGNYHFVGIDISKAKFDVCILSDKSSKNCLFENNTKGFKQFAAWLSKQTDQPWVCLEATGPYSEGLADFLVSHNILVSIINPMRIRNYAKSILCRNKNDALDAKVIAKYARSAAPLRPYKPRKKMHKEVRDMVQLIETFESQKRQLTNKMSESAICSSVAIEYKKMIRSIDMRIAALDKKLKQTIQQDKQLAVINKQLLSIVGIGEKTASSLIAYLPDISLFNSGKQLAAFAGLSPRQRESGAYKGQTKISKFGHVRLRNALYMPALVVKRHNKAFQPFCKRLEKNGLKPKAIICAIMRKLLHIIYGMLKHEQEFNPGLV